MNSKEVIKHLKEEGWYLVSTKGSHHKFKHPTKPQSVVVPHPKKDLQRGLVIAIFKQAELERPQ